MGKRLFDVVFASAASIMLSPLIAVIALGVWARIGRPVLFMQERPGLKGRPFHIVKFRTMADIRDVAGHLLPDGERLTPLGRMLRATSLDELPELWNVLRGEMSLVGPRPLLTRYLNLYSPEQRRRHDVRPGITGWAQINGRNTLSWEDKFALDLFYVDHRSFWLDLHILLVTVWRVLHRAGISAPGEATMTEFKGIDASRRDV